MSSSNNQSSRVVYFCIFCLVPVNCWRINKQYSILFYSILTYLTTTTASNAIWNKIFYRLPPPLPNNLKDSWGCLVLL